jgi:hypothetical protein
MTDIVERLRKENSMPGYYGVPKLQEDAADKIETLTTALEEVRDLILGANHSEKRYPIAHAVLTVNTPEIPDSSAVKDHLTTTVEIARLKAEVASDNHAMVKYLVQIDEQAAEIARLKAKVDQMREALDDALDRRGIARRLAARYNDNPARIADLCDSAIDRTGRLLGYVREAARAALTPSQEPRP